MSDRLTCNGHKPRLQFALNVKGVFYLSFCAGGPIYLAAAVFVRTQYLVVAATLTPRFMKNIVTDITTSTLSVWMAVRTLSSTCTCARVSQKKPTRLLQQSVGAKEPDYAIRQEIRAADRLLSKNKIRQGLSEFERLLKQVPECVRCKYGESQALEALAEEERSNSRLEQAIGGYKAVM